MCGFDRVQLTLLLLKHFFQRITLMGWMSLQPLDLAHFGSEINIVNIQTLTDGNAIS